MGEALEKQRQQQDSFLLGLHDHWMIMKDDNMSPRPLSSSSIDQDSSSSISNGSSSDLVDDDESSSTSTSYSSSSSFPSNNSNGPLFELSDLMAQLPIKRGLSKYFEGKSQSFTSLSSVRSLEDLAKKESPCRKKMKPCKSYGGGLDSNYKSYTLPKATIAKKVSRVSCYSLSFPGSKRGSFLSGSRPPPIPVQKKF